MLEIIRQNGFCIVPGVFKPREVDEICARLDHALEAAKGDLSVRTERQTVYAARNVNEWFPEVCELWRRSSLTNLLREVLGDTYGLVRVLFFDKPLEKPWSLPWHKDMTIAVKDNKLPSTRFRNPTTKAGIPHVEASEEILQRMLTLRLHLDDVDESNGPLSVISGSHLSGKQVVEGGRMTKILVSRGDVLAMRPLVSHSSPSPTSAAVKGRRILHFEFAADQQLPDGFQWRMFDQLETEATAEID